ISTAFSMPSPLPRVGHAGVMQVDVRLCPQGVVSLAAGHRVRRRIPTSLADGRLRMTCLRSSPDNTTIEKLSRPLSFSSPPLIAFPEERRPRMKVRGVKPHDG